ncbi:uncharacterized protein LOC125225671 [Leguminivora glycinivorella]|uniref:uncharacterized protein LOC125225671 n=1 Tax=Leguminivora glycinivorella TaxID=1035111 RepID=UPI00200E7820|nr:uncharacterized protein LOC125225671 [Leguminivora glycinivorella]
MPTQMSMKQHQRGQTLVLSYGVVTQGIQGSLDEVTTEPLIAHDLVLVKFTFNHIKEAETFKLATKIHVKKIASAKSSIIKMNLTYGEFTEQFICPESWSMIPLGSKVRDYHINDSLISNFEAKITVNETKVVPVQKQILFEDEDLIDFHLCAPDGRVGIQKAFLGLHSEAFMMMLKREWKETLEGKIGIEGVTKQTLQDLKQYIYLGTLPDEGLEPLLVIATRYMMDELKVECTAKLVKTITPEKLDDLVEFACLNNLPDLMRAVLFESTDKTIQGLYDLKMNKEEAKPEEN